MLRPDQRRTSINSFQSQVLSSNGSLAVVRHDGMNGGDEHNTHAEKTAARDLIRDETLSSLIGEVRVLRMRCDSLKEANAELKVDVRIMREAQAAMAPPDKPQRDLPAMYERMNLTGYASSEDSASSDTVAYGRDAFTSKTEFGDFTVFVNKKFDAMTQILERFQIDLTTEGVARYKLGQELERAKHDATKTKGRLGAMERDMKEARKDFEELADSAAQRQGGRSPSGQNMYDGDAVHGMQQKLQAAFTEIEDLTSVVKDQASAINGLRAQLDHRFAHAAPDRTDLTAADYASRISKGKVERGREMPEYVLLQRAVSTMMRKAENQQKIDDLCNKDQLNIAYAHLSRCINENSSGEDILTVDNYTGTWDELLTLRDRVVRRLITVDHYVKALQAANRAKEYL